MPFKDIHIVATEPQAAFYALTCRYPAFVGGYGSGKSETMLNQAIIDASMGADALVALYTTSYDQVRLNLGPRLLLKLQQFGIPYDYNKTENFITTHTPQFGNFVLRSLDAPERIIGYESFRAHIDEIDILPVHQANMAWDKILGRNRQVLNNNREAINRISAYSTPEGFKFLYNRWVKNKIDGYELIQASSRSNPKLRIDYIESLEASYPPHLVEAYIEGRFVNLTSGTIYKSFNRDTCNSTETVRPLETLYIGCDFNVTKMAAIVAVKRLNASYHVVNEFFNLYDTPDLIASIKSRYPLHHIVIYPDASGASRKSVNASVSDIALLELAGFEVRAPKRNPFVKDRILAANSAFHNKSLYINTAMCPNLTESLEHQAYADNGEPDKTSGHDHLNDALGYFVVYEMPVHRPVAEIFGSYVT